MPQIFKDDFGYVDKILFNFPRIAWPLHKVEFEPAFDAVVDKAVRHLEKNKSNFATLDEVGLLRREKRKKLIADTRKSLFSPAMNNFQ